MAKKASTTKSTGRSDPVATSLKANSKGDDHAEYMTSMTRNACHHLPQKVRMHALKTYYAFKLKQM